MTKRPKCKHQDGFTKVTVNGVEKTKCMNCGYLKTVHDPQAKKGSEDQ